MCNVYHEQNDRQQFPMSLEAQKRLLCWWMSAFLEIFYSASLSASDVVCSHCYTELSSPSPQFELTCCRLVNLTSLVAERPNLVKDAKGLNLE